MNSSATMCKCMWQLVIKIYQIRLNTFSILMNWPTKPNICLNIIGFSKIVSFFGNTADLAGSNIACTDPPPGPP